MPKKSKYTPPQFNYLLPPEECDRIYTVLGGHPKLDPCGHPDQYLQADTILYGTNDEDDGFKVSWSEYGTVVLNATHGEREPDWEALETENPGWARPDWTWHPYSRWVMKASAEAQRGTTVLAFMPASTDRKWFHTYVVETNSIALLERRVKCYVPSMGKDEHPVCGPQPANAHMMVLWTKAPDIADRFFEVYKTRGMIVEPVPVSGGSK